MAEWADCDLCTKGECITVGFWSQCQFQAGIITHFSHTNTQTHTNHTNTKTKAYLRGKLCYLWCLFIQWNSFLFLCHFVSPLCLPLFVIHTHTHKCSPPKKSFRWNSPALWDIDYRLPSWSINVVCKEEMACIDIERRKEKKKRESGKEKADRW